MKVPTKEQVYQLPGGCHFREDHSGPVELVSGDKEMLRVLSGKVLPDPKELWDFRGLDL